MLGRIQSIKYSATIDSVGGTHVELEYAEEDEDGNNDLVSVNSDTDIIDLDIITAFGLIARSVDDKGKMVVLEINGITMPGVTSLTYLATMDEPYGNLIFKMPMV